MGDRQGFVPWASGISLVAFGLVEGRSLGRSQHPCLCPARDRVCTRPIGTPGACVPWGTICVHIPEETMHVCIPQGSTLVCIPQGHRGTCVRSCHCRSSSTSPCPHHFPRRAPSGDLWARRRAGGEMHVSCRQTERRRLPRLLVQCNVCTHTCRKQSMCGRVCF